jgi:hypothetical protein
MHLAGAVDVVRVGALARQEPHILLPPDWLPDAEAVRPCHAVHAPIPPLPLPPHLAPASRPEGHGGEQPVADR